MRQLILEAPLFLFAIPTWVTTLSVRDILNHSRYRAALETDHVVTGEQTHLPFRAMSSQGCTWMMTTTHACLPCAFTRHALVQAFYREKETEDHGKNWIDSTPKHLRVADPKPGYLCFQPVWIRKKFRLLLKIWLERWEEKEQKREGRKEKKGEKLVEWEGWEKLWDGVRGRKPCWGQ